MDGKTLDQQPDPSGDEAMTTPPPEAATAEAPAAEAAPLAAEAPATAAAAPAGPTIKIKVKFSGGSKFEIDVNPEGSLTAMKEQCSEQCKVPSNQLRLFFKGKHLKDESITVQQANVQNGGQIFLVKGAVQGGEATPVEKKEEEPETTGPCVGGCGFFGSSRTDFYCSKCWNEKHKKEQEALKASPKPEEKKEEPKEEDAKEEPEVERPVQENRERCWTCSKKIGMTGFSCRCGYVFCATHRYAEEHNCDFDFKQMQRAILKKANPTVAADKLGR